MQWLTTVFDRHTKQKARNGRDPRLLYLDGHGSHINMSFLNWCEKHNVHICVYPPHTTHRLQPLDVSIFAPLATAYSQELDTFQLRTQGLCKMSKREFYALFKREFDKAFNQLNICSGWAKTGLCRLIPLRCSASLPHSRNTQKLAQKVGQRPVALIDVQQSLSLIGGRSMKLYGTL
jgi:DDE superfamily endonuclease